MNGVPGASAELSNKYRASQAFLKNADEFWHNKKWNILRGEIVWYDFRDRQFRPSKITFKPRTMKSFGYTATMKWAREQTPEEFLFVGSNDPICHPEGHWVAVCNNSYQTVISRLDEIRGCDVGEGGYDLPYSFRCLGLKVLKVAGGIHVSLSNIRMWMVVN